MDANRLDVNNSDLLTSRRPSTDMKDEVKKINEKPVPNYSTYQPILKTLP